jgi:flavorubredoxin
LTDKAGNKKVTIVYSTMTGNTAKIAQKLAQALEETGVETSVFNLKNADLAEVKERILESDGVLMGSSTKYADMVGKMEELLKSLEGEEVKGKFAAAFGSYGWSGEAIMHIENYLDKTGFTVINQKYLIGSTGVDTPLFPLRVRFAREENLNMIEEAGRIFGEQVLTC